MWPSCPTPSPRTVQFGVPPPSTPHVLTSPPCSALLSVQRCCRCGRLEQTALNAAAGRITTSRQTPRRTERFHSTAVTVSRCVFLLFNAWSGPYVCFYFSLYWMCHLRLPISTLTILLQYVRSFKRYKFANFDISMNTFYLLNQSIYIGNNVLAMAPGKLLDVHVVFGISITFQM